MGILGRLLGRKSSGPKIEDDSFDISELNIPPTADKEADLADDQSDLINSLSGMTAEAESAPVNIWDLDGGSPAPADTNAPTRDAAEAAAPMNSQIDISSRIGDAPARKRRTKTRLLGFDKSDGQVVDLFNNPVPTPTLGTRFPVGWVIVVKGPGRGESFTLQAGMSQIGRGEDQTVSLDFGDTAISRTNHAAIVYDPESFQFFLGHGGKSNIVRLNDKPVISNEALKTGDMIRLGETTLKFVALCSEEFNWGNESGEESDDVEIA